MSEKRERSFGWWRRALFGFALLATAAISIGVTVVAEASGGGSTTNVKFVQLTTPTNLFTAKSFALNASHSAVVIGGTTRVPTNATTVELSVEAGGTAAGVMNFYPTGYVSGGSGQYLTWSAGGTNTGTIEENVGLSNEVTFADSGGAATATASIIGYSTQVTDGDVSGADGTSGQVLTNNGNGASWQAPPGAGYEADGGCCTHFDLTVAQQAIISLSLPAGSYNLTFATGINNSGTAADTVTCEVQSPTGSDPANGGDHVLPGEGTTMTISGLVSTSGGKFTVYCGDDNGHGVFTGNYQTKLLATQLSSETGGMSG
jgi:hypothetical protein